KSNRIHRSHRIVFSAGDGKRQGSSGADIGISRISQTNCRIGANKYPIGFRRPTAILSGDGVFEVVNSSSVGMGKGFPIFSLEFVSSVTPVNLVAEIGRPGS